MAAFAFSDDELKLLAVELAPLLAERLTGNGGSPWLSADEAAEHLRCPVSRIRKLTMTGELPHAKDGRRVLYRRDELDGYLLHNGG